MTIGENIKKIRKEKGLTQQQLGKLLNISQSAIGQFENNKNSFQVKTLKKVAAALQVTFQDLLK